MKDTVFFASQRLNVKVIRCIIGKALLRQRRIVLKFQHEPLPRELSAPGVNVDVGWNIAMRVRRWRDGCKFELSPGIRFHPAA